MTPSQKSRLLRNMVVMALADGSFSQREVNLLADRCLELGMGQPELEAALSYGLSDDAALELPDTPEQQHALLRELIRMMAADGVLEESEKRLFALAAAKMGVPAEKLSEIIAAVSGPSS
ncbi:MAG: TerB family tellurite resistance protein [Planctomycetota bacterium]